MNATEEVVPFSACEGEYSSCILDTIRMYLSYDHLLTRRFAFSDLMPLMRIYADKKAPTMGTGLKKPPFCSDWLPLRKNRTNLTLFTFTLYLFQ